jgi:phage shock protein PspC (stress-responsive transcriptional regulator)
VCAGFASIRGISAGWVRLAFIAATLLGGLGLIVYLACWLIIPAEGEDEEARTSGTVVVVAQALAGCVGLTALAVLAATATVFGFGWLVFGLAAVVLAGVLGAGRRVGPGWALLPIAALALPAVAVATSDVRLTPQAGHAVDAPARLAVRGGATYRSGLGTMVIDLRRTQIPASGTVPLRIEAGVRRTIIALPADSCVRVRVSYHVDTFVAGLAALLSGRNSAPFSDLVVFGRTISTRTSGTVSSPAQQPGPVLDVDFSSQGGSLYVRSYPDAVDPEVSPNWPGYYVHPEPYPYLKGEPRKVAQQMVRAWHTRLAAEQASARFVDARMAGPCVPPPPSPARHTTARHTTARHTKHTSSREGRRR